MPHAHLDAESSQQVCTPAVCIMRAEDNLNLLLQVSTHFSKVRREASSGVSAFTVDHILPVRQRLASTLHSAAAPRSSTQGHNFDPGL
jgi:hypothetical protein